MPVVFSGIQPSGEIQLGNYLGAVRNWVKLQESHECIFCVVDLHAITAKAYASVELSNNTLRTIAVYIACGIDCDKSIVFPQSAVSGHAELCWLLSCNTPLGWLNRMTQFKDKSSSNKQSAYLGLYSYPVLMAADVLLYNAQLVPVGDDQRQHLELVREIATSFNSLYNVNYFTLPQPMIPPGAARIMSLRDGAKKMSKSDPSDYSRINLDDSDDLIVQKIRKAKTDSVAGFEFASLANRPEVCNLVSIYAALKDISLEAACCELEKLGSSTAQFKQNLADLLISHLSPIRLRVQDLLKDRTYVQNIGKNGAERASVIAEKTLSEIKDIIGFVSFS